MTLFCGRDLKCFSPLRGTNFNILSLLSYLFRLNTLIGKTKDPAVDLLMLNTLRSIKITFHRLENKQVFQH